MNSKKKPLAIQINYTLTSMVFTAKNAVGNTLAYVQQHYDLTDRRREIYNLYWEINKLLDKYDDLIEALILSEGK